MISRPLELGEALVLRQLPDLGLDGGLSIGEFERAVLREKARTERNGRRFSLLVFTPRGPREDLERLLPILARRVRLSDLVGRLDAERLAVILPETGGFEAWTLADSVLDLGGASGLEFDCSVHTFPFEGHSGEDDHGGGDGPSNGNGTQNGNGTHRNGNGKHAPLVEDPGTPTDLRAKGRGTTRPSQERRPVGDLSQAFLLPLPRWKRCMDVILAALLLVVAIPVSILTAIAIKLTSPGPILFKQLRVGRAGRTFTFYKFRTMCVDAEASKGDLLHRNEQEGPVFKMANDPRVTPIGTFLRRSSIDEIPQLWNVLRGDMALVGPRPPTPEEVSKYETWQLQRLNLTGGLTGSWQVSGRSLVGFVDWVRMDIRYARERGFWHDLVLLAKTPWAVLSRRGAF